MRTNRQTYTHNPVFWIQAALQRVVLVNSRQSLFLPGKTFFKDNTSGKDNTFLAEECKNDSFSWILPSLMLVLELSQTFSFERKYLRMTIELNKLKFLKVYY